MALSYTLHIHDTCGPLFLIREVEESDGGGDRAAVVAALDRCYPQFRKRHAGWRLSIEELHYLLQLPQQQHHNEPPTTIFHAQLCSEAVRELYEELRSCTSFACALYLELTGVHHYMLRHGGQFGALFIGYKGSMAAGSHGEVLFFAGPLSAVEEVAASRVAWSVGKKAMICQQTQKLEGIIDMREIPAKNTGNNNNPDSSGHHVRKKRRK